MPSRADNSTVHSYTDKCIGIDIDIFVDMHSHKQHTNAARDHTRLHLHIQLHVHIIHMHRSTHVCRGTCRHAGMHPAQCSLQASSRLSAQQMENLCFGPNWARHVACRAYCSWMNSRISVARPASQLNCCHLGKRAACLKPGRVVATALAAALLIFCHLGECAAQAYRAY